MVRDCACYHGFKVLHGILWEKGRLKALTRSRRVCNGTPGMEYMGGGSVRG